ncbi:MAG: benzoate-CoA ligase family protein [Candidatus Tectomicrobia bacterium]|nr:benzoate-CoA ligase family protein [Candidatus Tectomicrobia bacterium]
MSVQTMQEIMERFLPAPELWPERRYPLPEFRYPERFNSVTYLLDDHLEAGRGNKVAVYYRQTTMTYGQLAAAVNRLGNALRRLGIRRLDRVLLRYRNEPDFIIAWLAVLRLGAVCVSTMPLFRAHELTYIANDAEVSAILCAGDLTEEVERGRGRFTTVRHCLATGPAREGFLRLDELQAAESDQLDPVFCDANDLALIAYTSGTTGEPKGAAHFHIDNNIIADAFGRHVVEPRQDDIFGGHPPLAFTYGLGGLLIIPLRFGAATSMVGTFTPETMLETIHRHRITVLFAVPTAYNFMLQHPGFGAAYDLSSLRACISAGEPLPASLFHAYRERLGIELLDGIGSTEMYYTFLSNRPGHVKAGTTGVPVPGYEVRLVDEQLNDVPLGEPGMLAVRGPLGIVYWRKPERQQAVVRQGWNFTGDMYRRGEDGFYTYVCRNDDLIISGGYNIGAPEVEHALMQHPRVLEAAVIGAPDSQRGMVVKAFVMLKEPAAAAEPLKQELRRFVKERLAPFKYPRLIEFVDDLPRTPTGKIRRTELRQREQAKHPQS